MNFQHSCTDLLITWFVLVTFFMESISQKEAVLTPSSSRLLNSGHNRTDRNRSLRGEILKRILRRVNPMVSPDTGDGKPTTVKVKLVFLRFETMDEFSAMSTLSLFLHEYWTDARLNFTKGPDFDYLELKGQDVERVWIPNFLIYNERDAMFHVVTVPNRFIHIYPGGKIFYSIRLTLTLQCKRRLEKYPFDNHKCTLIMGSSHYTTSDVRFQWHPTPLVVPTMSFHGGFDLVHTYVGDCSKDYEKMGIPYIIEPKMFLSSSFPHHSCIWVSLNIARRAEWYLVQEYLPSILIVLMSWIPFWVDMNAIVLRIILGVGAVLAMIKHHDDTTNQLLDVFYPTALDVWMAACHIFVVIAFVEFAFANMYARQEQMILRLLVLPPESLFSSNEGFDFENKVQMELTEDLSPEHCSEEDPFLGILKDTQDEESIITMSFKDIFTESLPMESSVDPDSYFNLVSPRTSYILTPTQSDLQRELLLQSLQARAKRQRLDKVSRYLFPAAFLLFNYVYWTFYSLWQPEQD